MIDTEAYRLREQTGTSGLEETACKVASVLADYDIPHLFVGGLAVQKDGCARVTLDVNVVVPDVLEALEFLTADVTGPFARVPNCEGRLNDRRNGVKIDLLPAGRVLKRGCKVPFPEPKKVWHTPQIVGIEDLISLKLDSWSESRLRRAKDFADVIELIKSRTLPRDLAVAPAILHLYLETWDGLQAER